MKREAILDSVIVVGLALAAVFKLICQKQIEPFFLYLCLSGYIACRCLSFRHMEKEYARERQAFLEKLERKEREKYRLDCEEEIKHLQNQINPHFLYNTLDSIRGQALSVGEIKLADMVEALSSFFRYSISRRGNIVSLEEEIRNVKTYVKIQKFRFEERFDLKIEMDASDGVMECLIPKMTLQPIVENAIYHGIETGMRPGIVTVRIIETEERLLIYVTDNGVGISKEKLKKIHDTLNEKGSQEDHKLSAKQGEGNGLALRNVNERIHIYYGDGYGISIYSTVNVGTEVEIRLPTIKEKEALKFFEE